LGPPTMLNVEKDALHRLADPLAVVLSTVQTLRNDWDDISDETRRKLLSLAWRSAEELSAVIYELAPLVESHKPQDERVIHLEESKEDRILE
jgi:light-regulated signal transduction histidine kinase (bacteriophytochrome)